MDLSFSPEQDQLRDAVHSYLAKKSAEVDVRRVMATREGYDVAVWQQLAQELGLQGLAIPERHGGSGFGWRELGIVFEEMGRFLLCAPFFATVALAASAVIESGDEAAQADLLPGIASGETIATLALLEDSAEWTESAVRLEAVGTGDGWSLSGTKSYVLDAHVADWFVVVARTAQGVSLFVVDSHAPGVVVTPLDTMDQTRKQAHVTMERTPARLLGAEGLGWPVVSRVLDMAAAALACEQAGGSAAALEMSVDYAKVRQQFGRPIGSFQAIKHMCADLLVALESARSAAYYAAWAAESSEEELPVAASMAKSFCSDAYFQVASQTIQIHGGIGFTWEHPAHLYFKRARTSELILGSPAQHRDLLARRLMTTVPTTAPVPATVPAHAS